MSTKYMVFSGLFAGLLALGGQALASEDEREYSGRELMTEQERVQHQDRMRSLETEEERKENRHEEHERMEKRAKEQGKRISEESGEYRKGK